MGDSTYLGVDIDEEIIDLARDRLGRTFMIRDRHRAAERGNVQSLVALQSIACTTDSFIPPADNIPQKLTNGKPLGDRAYENLDWDVDESTSRFEIKTSTTIGVENCELGEGVFLKQGAPKLVAGTYVPTLCFYGKFVPTATLDEAYPEGLPVQGVFELQAPLNLYSLEVSPKCPGGKINDAKGTPPCTSTQSHLIPQAPGRM